MFDTRSRLRVSHDVPIRLGVSFDVSGIETAMSAPPLSWALGLVVREAICESALLSCGVSIKTDSSKAEPRGHTPVGLCGVLLCPAVIAIDKACMRFFRPCQIFLLCKE